MAIATFYRGIEYRSRLEARWAAFFTRISWKYTYEPFDGDGYIPDFLIHGDRPLLVEVKPASSDSEFAAPIDKVTAGLAAHWRSDILIVGVDPMPAIDSGWQHPHHPAAGLLGETVNGDGWAGDQSAEPAWSFGAAVWNQCGECGVYSVFHENLWYACRPCGHADGDGYLTGVDPRFIEAAWAEATNDVKWRGRSAA